jgi:serine/threonine protein kinase
MLGQDKYEEIKSVGKGSFGDVWLVRRKKDDRQFVLKKMHVGKTDKEVRHAR